MIFDDVKNITMYFLRIQRKITRFMIQYDLLRRSYKALKKKSRQVELSSIIFKNSNTIVNLQAQLIINKKLLQKQTKTINKHRAKRAAIDAREKKVITKLKK